MAEKRVVIVTGGAKGIGLACAQRFYEDGDRVVIADADKDAGEKAIEQLGASANEVIFVPCDVSSTLAVHNLIAQTICQFGKIDVLVNNAGMLIKGGSLDLNLKDFDKVMAVNIRGAFMVAQAVAKHMIECLDASDDRSSRRHKPYAIINMSSVNAVVAIPNALAYEISKGGINQMTKGMALELAPYGIRVNAVGPGSVQTGMLAGIAEDKDALATIQARTPLGRIAHPDEIAGVVAFLASPDASYITGEVIYADGGRLALNYTMPRQE